MTLIWNIIQSVITILEIRVCVWMMEKFAEPRYSGKKQKIVVWIVTLGVGGLYAANRWTSAYFSRVIMLIVFATLSLATLWLFVYRRGMSIFVIANYVLVSGMMDIVVMCFVEVVGQKPELFVYVDYINDKYRIGIMILSKTLLFLVCWVVQTRINKKVVCQLNEKKIKVFSILLCIIEYIGVHILTEILSVDKNVTYEFLIRLLFSLILILLLLAAMGIVALYYDQKAQLKHKIIFLDSLNYENQRIIKLYREREVMYHDFKNHLLALDGFVQKGDFEQYYTYFEQIKKPFLQKAAERKIGHDIMDLILNYKIGEAEQKKIKVKVRVLGYMDFRPEITDEDACSLMGNLWDNAIEACERFRGDESWINFQMSIKSGKILLEITNPYSDVQYDEQGKLCTTKSDKGIHGIGIRTIKDITERYHGYFRCIVYDHVFKAEVMICNK